MINVVHIYTVVHGAFVCVGVGGCSSLIGGGGDAQLHHQWE